MAELSLYFESQNGAGPPDNSDTEDEEYERGELTYNERITSKGLPTCAGCHGIDGKGIQEAEIPNISNFRRPYIEIQLKNFRSGKRRNDPNQLMKHVTEGLTDDEISDLSLYINEMQ